MRSLAALRTGAAAIMLAAVVSGCASPGPVAAASPVLQVATSAASVNPCTATAAYAAEVTDSGRLAWKVPLPSGQTSGTPVPEVIGGVAVFGGDRDLTGLRVSDGRRLWDVHTAAGSVSEPEFWHLWQWNSEVIALAGPYNNLRLEAVDAASGRIRWQLKLGGANVEALPALGAGGLLAVQVGRTVEVVSLATGRRLWSRQFVEPDGDGVYGAVLTVTSGVVVAAYSKDYPPAPGKIAGFSATTGRRLWTRGGVPLGQSLAAAERTVYLSGGDPGAPAQGPVMTAIAAATGEQRWRLSTPAYVDDLQATRDHVLYYSGNLIYDTSPRTGALRWKVPGEPFGALVSASRMVYVGRTGVTSLRLSDGEAAWRRNLTIGFTTFLASPRGPNLLVGAGNSFDDAPATRVYVLNRATGKTAAAPVRLPSDLPAAPAVTGRDAIYQVAPQPCETA